MFGAFGAGSVADVRQEARNARNAGGLVVRDIPGLGVRTLAYPLCGLAGGASAALSVSTLAIRMTGAHREEVASLLKREAATIRDRLTHASDGIITA